MSRDEGDTGASADTADPPPSRPAPGPGVPSEPPVLPDLSRDEQDVGWGDEPGRRDDDWYRRERPPHHGG